MRGAGGRDTRPTRASVLLRAILLFALLLTPALAGCAGSASRGEGVAIYLLPEDIHPADLAKLSYVDLPSTPILAGDDLIAYTPETHEFEVSADAFEAMAKLQVPVWGRAFAVCVDGSTVFTGAFWTGLSSLVFDGVVIRQDLGLQKFGGRYWVRLDLGYPGEAFFKGADPRNDPRILEALKKAGKLAEDSDN